MAKLSYHKNETTQTTDPAIVGDLTTIRLDMLQPHPDNPRLYPREEVISDIAAHLREQGQFLPEYALLVRPLPDGTYQIISGHHRYAAAQQAGLTAIPCWCREMSDAEAHMELALANRQDALTPLEWGLHALRTVKKGTAGRGKTGGLSEYARIVRRSQQSLTQLIQAATVYTSIQSTNQFVDFSPAVAERTTHLIAIHKAPEPTWATLVTALLQHDWSVKETEQVVKRVTTLLESRPDWWELDRQPLIATALTNEVQPLVRVFTLVQELDQQLSPVTIYQHQQTDEIREIHGREHRKWEPIAESYDQQAIFRERLTELAHFPDSQTIRAIHHEIIAFVASHAQASEQWYPVLTDEEHQAQQERERALAESTRRARYTPVLYPTEVLHGLQQLGSGSIDLIIADPPYNVGKAEWDMLGSGEDYAAWSTPWLQEGYRVLKETGSIYVFGVFPMLRHLSLIMDQIGFHYRDDIVWDTIQGTGGGLWVNRKELILFASKGNEYYADPAAVRVERHEAHIREYKGQEYRYKNVSNIWRFPCVDAHHPERTAHPTQKPVALLERMIRASSPPDGLVLDPFMGSGTTGVAAMHLERRCIGIERHPPYTRIAQDRWEQTSIGECLC